MRGIRGLMVAVALVVMAVWAGAQRPGMPNLTPQQMAQLQAKMKAWEKWRTNNKYVSELQQTVMAFRLIEENPKTKLTPEQAKKVVPVFKAWRKKSVMSNEDARKVQKQLVDPLNIAQLKTIATAPKPGQGGRGFGGGARMGGGQRRSGGGGFDLSKFPDPKDYNPLNPDSFPGEGMRKRFGGMLDKFVEDLAKRAK